MEDDVMVGVDGVVSKGGDQDVMRVCGVGLLCGGCK